MPKLAANLSWIYQEVPFLQRFGAAAGHGFKAVEILFPYEAPAADIAAELKKHKLTQALFNLPPGDASKGERGLAALPGREAEFAAALDKALDYAEVLECRTLHVMSGMIAPGADVDGDAPHLRLQPQDGLRPHRQERPHAGAGADQPPRHSRLFHQHHRLRCSRSSSRGRRAASQAAARPLSPAGHRGRPARAHRAAVPDHRARADRRQPRPQRARHRRGQPPLPARCARPARLPGLCRPRIQAQDDDRQPASAGPRSTASRPDP